MTLGQKMDTVELARFRTAAKKNGWTIQSEENSHVLISRPNGLPKFWVRLGICLVPIGVGLAVLLFHVVLKNLNSPETLKIDSNQIEGGFYPHLLR